MENRGGGIASMFKTDIYSQRRVAFRVHVHDSEWELCSAKCDIFRKKDFVFDCCLMRLRCQVASICYVSIITRESRHKRTTGHQVDGKS